MADYTIDHLTMGKDGNTYSINQGIPYGLCESLAMASGKTVTVDFFPGLKSGITVNIKFRYGNIVPDATLNVNSTGAKPIVKYGSQSTGDGPLWNAGEVYSFTYDGLEWIMHSGQNGSSSGESAYSLKVDCGTVQDDGTGHFTKQIENSSVSNDMEVMNYSVSNGLALVDDWTVVTGNGIVTISGEISGSTTLIIYLNKTRTT